MTKEGAISGFETFMATYPQRDDGHDVAATMAAWADAIRRARPEAIIAGARAYAIATEGRERRYIMGAARSLREGRWRDAGPISGASDDPKNGAVPRLVWISYGSPAWDAWSAFYRATKGQTPPKDRNGGWRFPAQWPPSIMQAAE